MLTAGKQEGLVAQILRASFETVSLPDFGAEILPLLERAFDTSASLFYRCGGPAPLTAISGSLCESCPAYGRDYYSIDPLHPAERHSNLAVSFLSRFSIWPAYLKSAVYNDFMHRRDADHLLHLRLTDTDYHVPGMVGLLLARSRRQPDFGKDEERTLGKIFGALQAATRRSLRLEDRLSAVSTLEAILDASGRGEIALTLEGSLLWASKTADDWLNLRRGGRENVPSVLVAATRGLGDLTRRRSASPSRSCQVTVPIPGETPVQAELRLARTASGLCFIFVELERSGLSPQVVEKLAPFQLTPA